MADAAAAQLEGETPPALPEEGNRHCPQAPAPSSRGWKDQRLACHLLTRLWHPQALHQNTGSASRREGEKKRGKAKKPPPLDSSVVPIWLLAACLPLGECYCNPCLLRSRALGKKSRGEPHTSGWKAREGGSGSSSRLAMLASRCKCAVAPGGQTSSGKRSSNPGASNSSTCRPITQWTATCSSHCLLTSLSSLIPHAAPAPGNIHEAIPFYWVAIGATSAHRLCLPEPAPGLLKRATPGCRGGVRGRRGAAGLPPPPGCGHRATPALQSSRRGATATPGSAFGDTAGLNAILAVRARNCRAAANLKITAS